MSRGLSGIAGFIGRHWVAGQSHHRPEISSFDFSLLNDWITPTELFFIREHLPVPAVSLQNWRLAIAGAVAAPYEIPYDELVRQPQKDLAATIECAENPVGGGLVSNAEWSGANLSAMLRNAKPLSTARFVRLSGADGYARAIPLSKAQHPDTLLAHRMNGEKLWASHGAPVRALIPGWYGMDSVKWLQKIEVLSDAANESYLRRTRSGAIEPVSAMRVKAAFARPRDGAMLFPRAFIMRGAAWAGEKKVRQVEASTDGGDSWRAARLSDTPLPYAWVRWEQEWKIPGPGSYELFVRASDEADRAQSAQRDPDRVDEYEQDAYQRVRVAVQ